MNGVAACATDLEEVLPVIRMMVFLQLSLLCACAATSQSPAVDASLVHRVGWYAEIDPRFYNEHQGITVFGNFRYPLENDWSFERLMRHAASDGLQRSGRSLAPVDLNAEELSLVKSGQCFSSWDLEYRQDRCGAPIANLLRRHQVDALLYVWTFSDRGDPSIFPGIGVSSQGSDRPRNLKTVVNVGMALYAGDPALPRYLGQGCFFGMLRSDHVWAKDVGDMEIEDWVFLRPELELLLARTIEKRLHNAGLIEGSTPTCPNEFPAVETL